MTRSDRGSATVWVVACCALVVLLGGVLSLRSVAVLARHRAETAADLAALAGAGRIGIGTDICAAARRVAARNGGRLRRCSVQLAPDGRSGTVTTTVLLRVRLPLVGAGSVSASARAARLPGVPPVP